ncbi:hypothetical protein FOB75_09405 [Vibrio parahaemolyticus]|uniref:hypothetical protein n=1 Tax=Vibrio parahaemolyticus TaxID=670 RepID=UPI00123A3634|nr:hypothetical protein [Vibrio parahaemolyticus]QET61110.1 hypothetical protein FOB75_09405 [Vibrio parahaemolyticus]
MIKNWTVVTQPVRYGSKGVACRERYLTSKAHPNHKNTCEIQEIMGSEKTSRYIALIGEQYRLRQQMSGKAGRHLSSYAMEYCLTLPKGVSPTDKQWYQIITFCCNSLKKVCNISNEQELYFNKCIRAVLHKQDQTMHSGSGDHVHLILGKVIAGKNPRVLNELQQKKATIALKSAFNVAVLKYVGLSHVDYTPSELNRAKKLEIWKAHKDEDIKKSKTIMRMQSQIDKWFSAFKSRNNRQLNRQFNRINREYANIINDTDLNEEIKTSLSNAISEIEKLSGRKVSI